VPTYPIFDLTLLIASLKVFNNLSKKFSRENIFDKLALAELACECSLPSFNPKKIVSTKERTNTFWSHHLIQFMKLKLVFALYSEPRLRIIAGRRKKNQGFLFEPNFF
jgi:hypothetical protein